MVFYFLQTVLETGLHSPCSYSGVSCIVSSSEKVLAIIIYFGKSLCQVLPLSGSMLYPLPAAQLPPSLLRTHRQGCVYISDSSVFFQQSRKFFSMSIFSTIPLGTSSNMIKIICGKIIIRGSNGLFCYLSERN